jgi:aspartate/methionine/tyrosine aminotransferase
MGTRISPITLVAEQCRQSGAANLAQGMADFAFNAEFTNLLAQDSVMRQTAYTNPRGLLALRRAIASYWPDLCTSDIRSDDEICVTPGATGAFAASILGLTRPGDTILIHEPFWDYHVDLVRVLGRKALVVPALDGRYNRAVALTLISNIANNVSAILVVSPGNPSGEIVPPDYIETLIHASRASQAVVILDEVYSGYIWSGKQGLLYNHPAARKSQRLVLCHSLSKSACLTGWRIGFAAGAAPLIDEIARANGLISACAAAPLQLAASIGLAKLPSLSASFRDIVFQSKEKIVRAFCGAGFVVREPDGGFFFLADVLPAGFSSGLDARERLLRDYGIGVVEAGGFYEQEASDLIRVCFAVPAATADRVSAALSVSAGRASD